MGMERWDPFREMLALRETMDRLVQQSLSGTGQLLSGMRGESIPMDVVERDDAYEVRAAVPGVKPEDVEVVVQGERLTVRAELRGQEERRDENWLMREHRYGSMQRSITLPTPVRSDAAEARVDNGVLILRLPKAQEMRPRRISIGGGASAGGLGAGATAGSGSTGFGGSGSGRSSAASGVGVGSPGGAGGAAGAGDLGGSAGSSSGQGGTGSTGGTGSASSTAQGPTGTQQPEEHGHAAGGHGHGSRDATAGGDRVTAESQESFPASDPPSWTPEKA